MYTLPWRIKLSKCVFAVNINISETEEYDCELKIDNNEDTQMVTDNTYHFNNIYEFKIPCIISDICDVYDIYVKPIDSNDAFTRIKSVYRDNFGKYTLNQDTPLQIDKTINVTRFDQKFATKGAIQIHCVSDISINGIACINANECGMSKDTSLFCTSFKNVNDDSKTEPSSKHVKKLEKLKYGRLIGDNNSNTGFGGGIIELVSESDITNNGLLMCNGSNKYYSGGTILINTLKTFINNGRIEANPFGQIIVKCCSFINNGTISPKPTIITNAKYSNIIEMNLSLIHKPWIKQITKIKKVKLSIYAHHGHLYGDTPDHLLNPSSDEYYCSKDLTTGTGDWITFRMNKPMYITNINIINDCWDNGIDSIGLFLSSDKSSIKYRLADIKDILMSPTKRYKPVQSFSISNRLLLTDYFLYKSKFNLLTMQVYKNHGRNWNKFYSFEVFGVEYA